ncbi:hypothetical protein M409DRAFT_71321 [Zasmidium cellare ATCC 36951]|uniref:Uncharacterized protein n=1 Tax=Zasmidium cellare ATCC 36951 TaxID=1080233 RepID=A0A6A6BWL4_ZASCE|nr:uncharacterized protein M409DRAFT_71321 [Zasmidium cellare ATCC 36951]KAF2159085.1 hypothetical protein M409DRAFT_71321 [Zasmidium cellare ATCC 36951]
MGALAIANVLHNCGLCDLQAVMIDTNSHYGALAASVVNTYYSNGDIPIAAIRPLTNETFFDDSMFYRSEYASKIAYNWPRALESANQTMTPASLYKSVLDSADNDSLTIVSIGFLNNLAALLSTTDGPGLISSKVHELVIMGGQYPSGWEYNFGYFDPASTTKVVRDWPRDIPTTYLGFELGLNVISGEKLRDHAPSDSPILAAYEWYNGRCSTLRESWDPLTTLYGILGLDGFSSLGLKSPFTYANSIGYNSITSPNASNAWVNDSSVTNQHWLELADGVSNTSVAWMLTQLYAHDPISQSCFG